MYNEDDYDLAGFCVGIVDKPAIIDSSRITPGDKIIGLASSGPHSNGYSLIRKILDESDLTASSPWEDSTLGKTLLTPTRIYVKSILKLIQTSKVHGIAHITGGGIPENLVRVLTPEVDALVNVSAWERPAIFSWLQEQGNVAEAEILRTFNCGIGMMVIVPANEVDNAIQSLTSSGETAMVLGEIVSGSGQVQTST